MQCTGNVPRNYGHDFDRCRSFASIYLDDLIIYFKTTQEHLPLLRQVSSILRAERFYAKPSKGQFFASELKFVGFEVSTNQPLCELQLLALLVFVTGLLRLLNLG